MSSASPFRSSLPDARPARGVQWLNSLVVAPLRAASFWTAVTLPFVLLALVLSGAAVEQVPLFTGLVTANFLALRVGHGHKRD